MVLILMISVSAMFAFVRLLVVLSARFPLCSFAVLLLRRRFYGIWRLRLFRLLGGGVGSGDLHGGVVLLLLCLVFAHAVLVSACLLLTLFPFSLSLSV